MKHDKKRYFWVSHNLICECGIFLEYAVLISRLVLKDNELGKSVTYMSPAPEKVTEKG